MNSICICVIYFIKLHICFATLTNELCMYHTLLLCDLRSCAISELLRCGINTLSNIFNYVTYQYYSVYYINLRVFDNIFCMLQTPLVHCLSNFIYYQLLVCEINITNIIIVFFHKHLYLNHLMTHIMIFYTYCGIHEVLIHCWCSCVNSDLKLCELPMYKFKFYDYINIIVPFYSITLTIYKHVCYILFTVTIIVENPNLYECMNLCMLMPLYNYYE